MNEELLCLLGSKADKSDVNELQNAKSNKVDTELALKWIEIVHKQLKQTAILITEIMKLEMKKANSKDGSTHNVINAKAFLYQQAQLICKWMNRFDPQSIQDYFDPGQQLNEPPELLAFQ